MQLEIKSILSITLLVAALLLTVPAWFAYRMGIIPRVDRIQTFHAPVFGENGKEVYYVTRNAWGISWGPGTKHS